MLSKSLSRSLSMNLGTEAMPEVASIDETCWYWLSSCLSWAQIHLNTAVVIRYGLGVECFVSDTS